MGVLGLRSIAGLRRWKVYNSIRWTVVVESSWCWQDIMWLEMLSNEWIEGSVFAQLVLPVRCLYRHCLPLFLPLFMFS